MNPDISSSLYADDTIIFSTAEKPSKALIKLQENISTLTDYYQKWGIKLNINKSSLICFRNSYSRGHRGTVKESKNLQLNLNGYDIPLTNSIKYLGINLHHRLLFNPHAKAILKKAYHVTSILKPLLNSKHLRTETKLLIYKTLIRPVIGYNFLTWFTISPSVAAELEKLERKILRHCLGKYRKPNKKWYSTKYLYEKCKITPLIGYLLELSKRSITRVENHGNPLIKEIYTKNINQSILDNYYLSPINIVNENSLPFFRPTTNNDFMLKFYANVEHNSNNRG